MPLVSDPPRATGQRRRLRGVTERRGSKSGMPLWGALLFGLPFVAIGTFLVLAGQRVVRVNPSDVHAPWWVLTVCGVCFAAGGLMVWGMAVTQQRAEHHRKEALRRHPASHAHVDYAWDPRGCRSRPWPRAGRTLLFAVFMTVFLSIFNWWAWGAGGPVMVKIIVSLFDLILVLVWWQALVTLSRAIKFSSSRVEFGSFPYSIKRPVAFRWIPPRGVGRAAKGEFTLRCVEEFYEERGSGKDRSKYLVHEEICAETQSFDHAETFAAGRPVELRFAPPENAPATALSADRPVFWEFEVKLKMAGPDFEERFLIPIYA